jgi:cyclopropane-fatty-acyl-phospholipid synthase
VNETNIGASPDAIEFHYDVGTDFYAVWLDPSLTYSAALWDGIGGDESETSVLAAAQRAKLLYHLGQAAVTQGGRLLDVGCGWGSLLALAGRELHTDQLTGLTLSRDQLAHVRSLGLPETEVKLEHWRDHRPRQPYDAIVSIGAFEHFAHRGLTAQERIQIYSEFFAACYQWLPARGVLSLQTIAFDDDGESDGPVGSFYETDVFPSSTLPRLSEIAQSCEPYFSVASFRNDADQYARTLRAWSVRLQSGRIEAERIAGEDTYRRYLRYLRVSKALFQRHTFTLYRLGLQRRPRQLPVAV